MRADQSMAAALTLVIVASIFVGIYVDNAWRRAVKQAPLQCRVELLDEQTNTDGNETASRSRP